MSTARTLDKLACLEVYISHLERKYSDYEENLGLIDPNVNEENEIELIEKTHSYPS